MNNWWWQRKQQEVITVNSESTVPQEKKKGKNGVLIVIGIIILLIICALSVYFVDRKVRRQIQEDQQYKNLHKAQSNEENQNADKENLVKNDQNENPTKQKSKNEQKQKQKQIKNPKPEQNKNKDQTKNPSTSTSTSSQIHTSAIIEQTTNSDKTAAPILDLKYEPSLQWLENIMQETIKSIQQQQAPKNP